MSRIALSTSSPRRRLRRASLGALSLAALLAAAGCGFTPVYGTPEAQATPAVAAPAAPPAFADLAAISIPPIADREGQELRNELTDRLNPARRAEPSRYTLRVSLGRGTKSLAIDRQGFATRGSFTLTASYILSDDASGRVLLRSKARTMVGYDVLNGQPTSYFSTLTAVQDAQTRAVTQVADQITARLAGFFHRHPGGIAAPTPDAAPREAMGGADLRVSDFGDDASGDAGYDGGDDGGTAPQNGVR